MTNGGSKDRIGIVLIAVALALIALTATIAENLEGRAQKRAADDVGTTGVPGSRQWVVLIDVTDPLPGDQVQSLDKRFLRLDRSELRRGEYLSVWSLGNYPEGELRRCFSGRYPGRDANILFENPRFIEARCDSLFSSPLARAVIDVLASRPSPRTELLDAFRELTELAQLGGTSSPARLLLISDLAENTPELSLYGGAVVSDTVWSTSPLRDRLVDLRGVAVEVLEIPRPSDTFRLRAVRRRFWRGYFLACGASAVRFVRL